MTKEIYLRNLYDVALTLWNSSSYDSAPANCLSGLLSNLRADYNFPKINESVPVQDATIAGLLTIFKQAEANGVNGDLLNAINRSIKFIEMRVNSSK